MSINGKDQGNKWIEWGTLIGIETGKYPQGRTKIKKKYLKNGEGGYPVDKYPQVQPIKIRIVKINIFQVVRVLCSRRDVTLSIK